ncbi:hypothetical protein EDI_263430 [Entamoeba dispar SAW760]|uniref:Uncharacterized protein n=1 Tax=Entamoeba dispar (strain ATCC PRA-260 / SAW760) TaxID=370354 RepID=B0ECI4_ENTDS|nr:uncharacterized protein EDI_263430 [Entamoeba dispar SAW760]EDR27744.1 hypothetical protein EDI_263430 [Entamoeba dispar SAW760]|eukprot:EDR27744.1 hypothetical protein EDI_263430 [Entamoeba dispar SAW760]
MFNTSLFNQTNTNPFSQTNTSIINQTNTSIINQTNTNGNNQNKDRNRKEVNGKMIVGSFSREDLETIKRFIEKKSMEGYYREKIELRSTEEVEKEIEEVIKETRNIEGEWINSKRKIEELKEEGEKTREMIEHQVGREELYSQPILVEKYRKSKKEVEKMIEGIDKTYSSCAQKEINNELESLLRKEKEKEENNKIVIKSVFERNANDIEYLSGEIEEMKRRMKMMKARIEGNLDK